MEDRDVSEQIALGLPAKKTGDGLFDQRLFGQNKGMDSGFDRKFFFTFCKVRIGLKLPQFRW